MHYAFVGFILGMVFGYTISIVLVLALLNAVDEEDIERNKKDDTGNDH